MYVGTAGWTIPRAAREHFPATGTQLERYAQVFSAVEINSSFHRPHRRTTYERWAAATPETFRFAVKMPKHISHTQRLSPPFDGLEAFLGECAGLGEKLAVLLLQLPPKLALDVPVAAAFFMALRQRYDGRVACEPRHASFFTAEAQALLCDYAIVRVAADPPRHPLGAVPGGAEAFTYSRLHGAPRVYYSPYDAAALDALTARLLPDKREHWVIFDNTVMGHAATDALGILARSAQPLAAKR